MQVASNLLHTNKSTGYLKFQPILFVLINVWSKIVKRLVGYLICCLDKVQQKSKKTQLQMRTELDKEKTKPPVRVREQLRQIICLHETRKKNVI